MNIAVLERDEVNVGRKNFGTTLRLLFPESIGATLPPNWFLGAKLPPISPSKY